MTALEIAQANLSAARQQLAAAQAEHDAQQRKVLTAKLTAVRAELRSARERYRKEGPKVLAQRQALREAQLRVNALNVEVGEHLRARPSCFDLLPDDIETREWSERHSAIVEARDQAIAERNALPNPDVPSGLGHELASYEGATGLLTQLQISEQNLLSALRNESTSAKSWVR